MMNEKMNIQPAYPTVEHKQAAEAIVAFFSQQADVDAVLLTCSCARGKASKDSCLDIVILANAGAFARLEQKWEAFYATEPCFQALLNIGKYSHVDLEFINGMFQQPPHGWTTGADAFELEIGNTLVYTVALWQANDRFQQLKRQWLPYYDETLRKERLEMARKYGLNNLDHIPLYVERGLYFQAFKRLHQAFEEFLQALFIARRTYPIAYDKWVREQIVDILNLPELYSQFVHLFEIRAFESLEIAEKGRVLERLFHEYTE